MSSKTFQTLLVNIPVDMKTALKHLKDETGLSFGALVQEAILDLVQKRHVDCQPSVAESANGGQQPVVVKHPFVDRPTVIITANIAQSPVPVHNPRIATTSFTSWIRDNRAGPQDYENIKKCLTGSRATSGRFSAELKQGTRDTEIRLWDHTSKSSELHLKNRNAISKFLIDLPELLKDAQNMAQQGNDGAVLFRAI